ncbi:MAG: threonylcarbamoyl-AMP synthase [Oscillospiraceae bacterium]|nr:threonylcarbamoyl-AMP synthase [Oscillospiraceae bacterium]
MNTNLLPADGPDTIARAAEIIRAGGLLGIPTETVYGLGANGLDPDAVLKIFEAKGRPQDNPLILHVAGPEQAEQFCHDIPDAARALMERFWPGPLTLILPARDIVPRRTTAGLDTVGVRCPATAVTREIIAAAGVPIAAPSANISGKPSPTTAAHVLHDMDGKIEAVVDAGPCAVGVESTIVDLTGQTPRLLRPGGIGPEQLRTVLGALEVDEAVLGEVAPDAVVRAPGMKYTHYTPQADVIIVTGSREAAARYILRRLTPEDRVLCFEEELPLYPEGTATAYGEETRPETLARGLFAALRELDRADIRTIYARCPSGGGVTYAVANRLKKAAGFHVVKGDEEP